jgi:glycopeptide antibiotics resistance protein
LVALAIGPIVTAVDWGYLKSLGPIQKDVRDEVATLLPLGNLFWKMSQGRNWARITLLVLFLLELPFYFSFVRAEFGLSAIVAALSITRALFQGAGLLLAFLPPAKDWFRKPAEVT